MTKAAKLAKMGEVLTNSQIGGRRNIIINGAMQVAQRGTSSTTNGDFAVDRFKHSFSGTDEAPTFAQVDVASGTTPYTSGFRKSLKVTNGNQTSGAGAGDLIQLSTDLEGQDIAKSGWNYNSTSSFIVLSFYVKSSVAQNFFGYLNITVSPTRFFPFETGTLTADTWTKVTKIIPGSSSPTLAFANDTASGLQIAWFPFFGTNFTASGVSLDTWTVANNSERIPDMTTTWYTTNDATFEITGVQLEVGSQATPFEHRSFGDELALCQRYCVAPSITAFEDSIVITGMSRGSTNKFFTMPLPGTMRSGTPSISITGDVRMLNPEDHNKNDGANTFTIGGVTPTFRYNGTMLGIYYNGAVTDVTDTTNADYQLQIVGDSDHIFIIDSEL